MINVGNNSMWLRVNPFMLTIMLTFGYTFIININHNNIILIMMIMILVEFMNLLWTVNALQFVLYD